MTKETAFLLGHFCRLCAIFLSKTPYASDSIYFSKYFLGALYLKNKPWIYFSFLFLNFSFSSCRGPWRVLDVCHPARAIWRPGAQPMYASGRCGRRPIRATRSRLACRHPRATTLRKWQPPVRGWYYHRNFLRPGKRPYV